MAELYFAGVITVFYLLPFGHIWCWNISYLIVLCLYSDNNKDQTYNDDEEQRICDVTGILCYHGLFFWSNYSIECMCCMRQRLKYILPNSWSQVWHCFILVGLQLRVVTFKNQMLINIWVLIVSILITWHIDNGIALAQSSIYTVS